MKSLHGTVFYLSFFLWLWPGPSFADGGDHEGHAGHHGAHPYYHYHDRPHFGVHISAFYPDEYFPVWAAGRRYYYDDGVFYDYSGGVYEVSSPPLGAVVGGIPADFHTVVVNGTTYYTDNGTYYVNTPSGYQVVSPPQAQAAVSMEQGSDFVVNVPNDKGGYTSVTLRRSGNGFVGPQGEFYSQFPGVPQLKLMYGK